MSIPASRLVTVNPAVVAVFGNALALNGLFLTQNLQMPTGRVLSFASAGAVSAFFGPASAEAAAAAIYFAGYDNSTIKPIAMLFAPFNLAARAGWLQSGSLATLSLTALKALSGVLTISVDGVVKTSSTITLSAATSFSNAATIIAAAFTGGPTVTWNPVNSTFNFTSTTTGTSSQVSFATGSLAAGLALTAATGAIVSAGAVLDTPASAMANAVAASQNWATFVTLFEPITADKTNFAVWANSQNNRYGYLAWDTDVQASVQGSTTCFGYLALQAAYNGVACIGGDPAVATATSIMNVAIFVAGAIASINFAAANGRITLAYRTQSGLASTCASDITSQNLLANGYSFYGTYATATQNFVNFQNGQMPGEFNWLQNFVNQIYLNAQLQLALLNLLTNVGSIGYNEAGYGLIRSAMADPIAAGISFGSIRTGVVLSAAEAAEINLAAGGVDAATAITNNGYYLQILDPGAPARAANMTPTINFWYADGGDVQQITLASIEVQ